MNVDVAHQEHETSTKQVLKCQMKNIEFSKFRQKAFVISAAARTSCCRGLGMRLKLHVAKWLHTRLIMALSKFLASLNLPDLSDEQRLSQNINFSLGACPQRTSLTAV